MAELTVSGGYLTYTQERPIHIPLTLLSYCKIVECTGHLDVKEDYVALESTQTVDTPSGFPEVKIYVTPTYTTIAAIVAFIEANTPALPTTAAPLYMPLVADYFIQDATYYYYGYAPIGTATSATGWKVKRTTIVQPNIGRWCVSGIMDNYASLTYL